MKPGVELRLVNATNDTLVMVWLQADTEVVIEELIVPRALYDAIAAASDDWAALRARLTEGAFVDMQRLYMVPV